ncbi:MAG: hypothetical protein VKO39_03400 [Cyanobacteriota bacterium]|nr:hypothetical protein [Cyanobacteriota bacterium]
MKHTTTEEVILASCLLVGWATWTILRHLLIPALALLLALLLAVVGWQPEQAQASPEPVPCNSEAVALAPMLATKAPPLRDSISTGLSPLIPGASIFAGTPIPFPGDTNAQTLTAKALALNTAFASFERRLQNAIALKFADKSAAERIASLPDDALIDGWGDNDDDETVGLPDDDGDETNRQTLSAEGRSSIRGGVIS